jgi:hypothetical protein
LTFAGLTSHWGGVSQVVAGRVIACVLVVSCLARKFWAAGVGCACVAVVAVTRLAAATLSGRATVAIGAVVGFALVWTWARFTVCPLWRAIAGLAVHVVLTVQVHIARRPAFGDIETNVAPQTWRGSASEGTLALAVTGLAGSQHDVKTDRCGARRSNGSRHGLASGRRACVEQTWIV